MRIRPHARTTKKRMPTCGIRSRNFLAYLEAKKPFGNVPIFLMLLEPPPIERSARGKGYS